MLGCITNLRRHLRFSLATLVVFVILCGAIGGCCYRWSPWAVEYRLPFNSEDKAVLSRDGSHLAISRATGAIQIYETGRGTLETTFHSGFPEGCMVRFSADGQSVLAWDRTDVRLWELEEPKERFHASVPVKRNGVDADLSEDGTRVVKWAPYQRVIWIWDVESRECLYTICYKEGCVQYDLTSQRVAWYDNATLRLMNMKDMSTMAQWTPVNSRIEGLSFSPDGRFLLILTDRLAYCWDFSFQHEPKALPGAIPEFQDYDFSCDSSTVAIACADRMVRFWRTATGELCPERIQHQPCAGVRIRMHQGKLVIRSTHASYWYGSEELVAGTDDDKIDACKQQGLTFSSMSYGSYRETWRIRDAELLTPRPFSANFLNMSSFSRQALNAHQILLAGDSFGVGIYDVDTYLPYFCVNDQFLDLCWQRGVMITRNQENGNISVWRQRRDPSTLGILKLPEFWLVIGSSGYLLYRLVRQLHRHRPRSVNHPTSHVAGGLSRTMRPRQL